ncbi:hypothetical protein F4819DRAFT_465865 [Hypoxylon fuscum]|nr:hypothetical protein F4819DRAFT_465865 [Hypoxylon fuscum]
MYASLTHSLTHHFRYSPRVRGIFFPFYFSLLLMLCYGGASSTIPVSLVSIRPWGPWPCSWNRSPKAPPMATYRRRVE